MMVWLLVSSVSMMHPKGTDVLKQLSIAHRSALATRLTRGTVFILTITLLSLMMAATNLRAQSNGSGWSPPINFSNVPDLFSDSPILLCDRDQNMHALW